MRRIRVSAHKRRQRNMSVLSTPATFVNSPIFSSPSKFGSLNPSFSIFANYKTRIFPRPLTVVTASSMASEQSSVKSIKSVPDSSIKLLFVEMGVGYDQHGYNLFLSRSLSFFALCFLIEKQAGYYISSNAGLSRCHFLKLDSGFQKRYI